MFGDRASLVDMNACCETEILHGYCITNLLFGLRIITKLTVGEEGDVNNCNLHKTNITCFHCDLMKGKLKMNLAGTLDV